MAASTPLRPATRHDFEIAIICALTLEADAAVALFDHHWDDDGPSYDKEPYDPNAYSTGAIGRHNVVLAHMPGMGKANAATVAAHLQSSFPNIKLALIVGICGAIPVNPDGDEIVLGDVIISDGVVQYDFGRQLPDRFVRKDTLPDSLGPPTRKIRSLLAKLKGLRGRRALQSKMTSFLEVLRGEPDLAAEYPGIAQDRLFQASYLHLGGTGSCENVGCDGILLSRRRLEHGLECQPKVHFGLIASGDTVMKSGEQRDAVAAKEEVIAFEMEGAGVWDGFPSVVIKGVCDYADSHKSKKWQRYAAATAAACMKAFLEHWVPSPAVSSTQLETTDLRREVTVTSITPEAQRQLQGSFQMSEADRQAIQQTRILEALAFPDMYGRFEDVEAAHERTFQWILADTTDHERRRRIESDIHGHSHRESLLHWLSSGSGIYHVAGKAGSGKSTLMKFLCNHPRTKAELQKWAGTRKLVFSNFFFWRPGSKLQKSLEGLLRSLLHDVLKACPELIPDVLPNQWKKLATLAPHTHLELDAQTHEIRKAFTDLLKRPELYKNHCFCFFIDGLDEFEETRQEDYKSMLERLRGWTGTSSHVKLCVSSREYNVFLNNLSAERRLRLQDLTKADIERYIRDRLQDVKNEHGFRGFVDGIVDKANGIFLWVALVVKSCRELLEESHDIAYLERRLDPLPEELEDLFRFLLKSVSKSARTQAFQTFAMLDKCRQIWYGLPLHAYFFLENYNQDKQFAMRESFSYSTSSSDIENRASQAQRRLNGGTRGLLEVPVGKIVYLHRSIPDFLGQPDVQKDMAFHLQDFDPVDALSQLILAQLRASRLDNFNHKYWNEAVHGIIWLRHNHESDHPPFLYLERLESALLDHGGLSPAQYPDQCIVNIAGPIHPFVIWGLTGNRISASKRFAIQSSAIEERMYITCPFHVSVYLAYKEYVFWKIRHNRTILDSDLHFGMLYYLSALSVFTPGLLGVDSFFLRLVELLLEQGVSPQRLIHHALHNLDLISDQPLTFWEDFVLRSSFFMGLNPRPLVDKRLMGKVIEKFLRCDADPCLRLSAVPDPSGAFFENTSKYSDSEPSEAGDEEANDDNRDVSVDGDLEHSNGEDDRRVAAIVDGSMVCNRPDTEESQQATEFRWLQLETKNGVRKMCTDSAGLGGRFPVHPFFTRAGGVSLQDVVEFFLGSREPRNSVGTDR